MKGTLPNIIFVAPTGRGKDKIQHKHVVLEVVEFDGEGRPKLLRLMQDDEVIDLQERLDAGQKPPSFMTAYCQRHSLGRWKNA